MQKMTPVEVALRGLYDQPDPDGGEPTVAWADETHPAEYYGVYLAIEEEAGDITETHLLDIAGLAQAREFAEGVAAAAKVGVYEQEEYR